MGGARSVGQTWSTCHGSEILLQTRKRSGEEEREILSRNKRKGGEAPRKLLAQLVSINCQLHTAFNHQNKKC